MSRSTAVVVVLAAALLAAASPLSSQPTPSGSVRGAQPRLALTVFGGYVHGTPWVGLLDAFKGAGFARGEGGGCEFGICLGGTDYPKENHSKAALLYDLRYAPWRSGSIEVMTGRAVRGSVSGLDPNFAESTVAFR